jgi:hypothetical protein
MVHSGYEATAVIDAVKNPFNVAKVALLGSRVDGSMAPEIPLDRQRPAEYVFRTHVDLAMAKLADSPDELSDERLRCTIERQQIPNATPVRSMSAETMIDYRRSDEQHRSPEDALLDR